METPRENSIHDLAMLYVDKKVGTQSPSASMIAQMYIDAYNEISLKFKRQEFDPMDEAPNNWGN